MVGANIHVARAQRDHDGRRLGGVLQWLGGINGRAPGQRGGAFVIGAAVWLPAVAMVGAFVALGSGYNQARAIARAEESASGFSQGFCMALLKWEWRHAVDRFGRRFIRINRMDESMDVIRVNAFNGGMKAGYSAGKALVPQVQKAYLSKIRQHAGVVGPKAWDTNADAARNQQISYVITLATAARRHQVLKAE